MPTLTDFLRVLTLQDYNTRIVLTGTLLFGMCSGVVGAFMLLRKKSLVGDVASHAALPGIGLAYLILESMTPGSGKSPVWLLVGAAVSSACGLMCANLIQRTRLIKEDSALGIVLSVFFGFGIVLLSVVQSLQTGSAAGLSEFVFGKAASLTAADVSSIAIASLLVLVLCLLLFKEFSLLCFDEPYAAALGWPTRRLDLLLTSLVVAVTVIGMPSVGLLLVVAQLVIPPTAARFWTDRHGPMTIMSGLLGGGSCALGIVVSALVPRLAAGAVIVLSGTAAFAVSLLIGTKRGVLWRWLRQRESHRRIGQLDLLRACFEVVEGGERQGARVESQTNESNPTTSSSGDLSAFPIRHDELLASRSWSPARLGRVLSTAIGAGMIRLDAAGHYRLTAEGSHRARRAARNHRLWEMYLIHFAHIAPSRVDREADEIEHVLEPELVDQLEELLEQDAARVPVPVNPHG
jgi:manganese/zinc/iron transport system permease protein